MSVRIVIVDDNVFLQKAVAEKLSFFDDLVLKFTANNGNDLLSKLEKNKNIDFIISLGGEEPNRVIPPVISAPAIPNGWFSH